MALVSIAAEVDLQIIQGICSFRKASNSVYNGLIY